MKNKLGILGLSTLSALALNTGQAQTQTLACTGKSWKVSWGNYSHQTLRDVLKIHINQGAAPTAEVYSQERQCFGTCWWIPNRVMGDAAVEKVRIQLIEENSNSIIYKIFGSSSEDASTDKNFAILTIVKSESIKKLVKVVDYNNALNLHGSYDPQTPIVYEVLCDVEFRK